MTSGRHPGSIFTPRLHLMRLRHGHPAMHQIHLGWLKDPEVLRFSEQRHKKHTMHTIRGYLNSFDHQKDHIFAILLKSNSDFLPEDNYIGNLTIHTDKNNGVAEMGMLIGEKREWKKGYGVEAWKAAGEWALANGTRKLEAGFAAPNIGMMKVLEKSGFRWEAVRHKHFVIDGKIEDMMLYGKFSEQG